MIKKRVCKSGATPYNGAMSGLSKKRIYLDYASAPPVLKEAEDALYAARSFVGNPGAIHSEGVQAKRALDDARTRIAALLGVKAREIIFTGGLTEANNIAIIGTARTREHLQRPPRATRYKVQPCTRFNLVGSIAGDTLDCELY